MKANDVAYPVRTARGVHQSHTWRNTGLGIAILYTWCCALKQHQIQVVSSRSTSQPRYFPYRTAGSTLGMKSASHPPTRNYSCESIHLGKFLDIQEIRLESTLHPSALPHVPRAEQGKEGDFACYFFPIVSEQCVEEAGAAIRAGRVPSNPVDKVELRKVVASDAPFVRPVLKEGGDALDLEDLGNLTFM